MARNKKVEIEVEHQQSKMMFKFIVANPAKLNDKEVKMICCEMAVYAILVEDNITNTSRVF